MENPFENIVYFPNSFLIAQEHSTPARRERYNEEAVGADGNRRIKGNRKENNRKGDHEDERQS